MEAIENLKHDISKLGTVLRESEKELYDRINGTDKNVADLNTSVKLIVDKLGTFIETFKSHDTNEMQKYDNILAMFNQSREETKKLEEKLNDKYVTKEDMKEFEKKLDENSRAIKQGFKYFYMGAGVLITIGTIGSLLMWVLNLISKLQSLGVH